jgi:DNA-directed RNA polymerase subunit RPC12/RpoP
MSMKGTETLECQSCGERFETTYWRTLNADINPIEKEQLLSGELFKVVCPKCGEKYLVAYPMLYHDMTNMAMIQFIANGDEDEASRAFFESGEKPDFLDDMLSNGYRFRFVYNQNELREKALIFNCVLDDRVIEYIKIYYEMLFSQQMPDARVAHILFVTETTHKLMIFTESGKTHFAELDMELYVAVEKEHMDLFDEMSKDCYRIDRDWAASVFGEIARRG